MVKNRTFLNSQNRTFLFSRYNHTSYNLYYVKLYICSSVMWFDLSTKKSHIIVGFFYGVINFINNAELFQINIQNRHG